MPVAMKGPETEQIYEKWKRLTIEEKINVIGKVNLPDEKMYELWQLLTPEEKKRLREWANNLFTHEGLVAYKFIQRVERAMVSRIEALREAGPQEKEQIYGMWKRLTIEEKINVIGKVNLPDEKMYELWQLLTPEEKQYVQTNVDPFTPEGLILFKFMEIVKNVEKQKMEKQKME
ncbi:MAG: hypothetical protein QXG98_01875 [Candidatus Micrarchaeia archaeon]